ncbi:MAG: hypothetical protein IPJ89_04540 [Candidatus Iainarchaeum archaeon]|uniref:Uncharacterized protein n=1 Tax=Candidatus Iainarchaeum sp. TaxID=3101447 RepID=A0A7T9DJB4_9ARCH|nr:MAG: hypothetical protein IPJ89_04540 [Candidatus Diapherotrites archaeon]
MAVKRWKSARQVTGIAVHRSHFEAPKMDAAWPKSGNVGHVLVGRMRMRNGNNGKSSRHWVAIKMFKHPIPDSYAARYQRTIERLRKAGVNIPKMGMMKFARAEGLRQEWHQVMQLFGNLRHGKLSTTRVHASEAQRELAAVEAAKILNAGFAPPLDALTFFEHPRSGVVVVDIDSLIRSGAEESIGSLVKFSKKDKAANLVYVLRDLSKSRNQFYRLFDLAIQTVNPAWRPLVESFKEVFARTIPDK